MQDYREYADDLVERIDNGDLDPKEVEIQPFVESEEKVLTPELAERLEGTGKIEEYNDRVRERDERDLLEEKRELSREQRDTIDLLKSTGSSEELTETVQIGDAEVIVRSRMTGELEKAFQRVRDLHAETGDLTELKDVLIDAILLLIVDDNESGRYDFQSREVWEAYYEEHGTEGLWTVLDSLMRPANRRLDNLFRRGENESGSGLG